MMIFKKYFFDAAHFMPNFPKDHKYGRVHGHTFEVTVRVNGNIDNENNWVINYDELDQFVTPLLKILDHKILNDINGLKNPTSENLARWFWFKLKKKIKNLESIEINRPRIGGCVFKGD